MNYPNTTTPLYKIGDRVQIRHYNCNPDNGKIAVVIKVVDYKHLEDRSLGDFNYVLQARPEHEGNNDSYCIRFLKLTSDKPPKCPEYLKK